MKTNPKTEKEISEANMVPNGTYPFEVVKAVDKKSKAGNDMIEVNIKVFVGDRTIFLFDYLLSAMEAKLFHFCQYTGLSQKYESGDLNSHDCMGKTGWVIIGEDKKSETPRNKVIDYARGEYKGAAPKAAKPAAQSTDDQGIPY